VAEVHLVVGCAVILLNLLAFAIGGVAWLRDRSSVQFWYLLRGAQAAVFAQAMLGGLLVFTGHEAPDDLHVLYGALPLLVSLLAEGARAGAAERELGDVDFEALPAESQQSLALAILRREMGIMAVSCGVILFLALRAAGTSGVF
jgi:heme A synthase